MEGKERKIVVAVDESKESMYALSWCITNLISEPTNNKLVLLYVKPPPAIHSFDSAGYIFSSDAMATMEKYREDLANSIMEWAETIYRKVGSTNIKMERVVGSGDAKLVICSAKLKADALVMGSYGYVFFKRQKMQQVNMI